MVNQGVRHISYSTRGRRIAGYVYLGVGVAGLLVALAAPWIFASAKPAGVIALRVVSAIGGVVFLFVGLLVAFKDIEVVVDPARRVLGIGWSWLRWRRMTLYSVEADARIRVETKEVSTGRTTTTYYPVSYVHSQGAADIVSGADYRLSRRRAEVLASSLGLSLVDHTSGSQVVRGPDALDRSAADPATLPEGISWPRLPRGTRMRARYERDTLSVTIPPPGFGGATLFALMLLGLGGVLAWALVAITAPEIEGVLGVIFLLVLGALALLFVYGGYYGVADTLLRTRRLVVSPRSIRMPRREGDREGVVVEAVEVEEIDLAEGGRGVIARTDERDTVLADYLTPEEAACLRDMVHLALAGKRPPK